MDNCEAAGAILALLYGIFAISSYVYISIALQKIAKKTNTVDSWFAWIPILNIILMIKIAEKPIWWTFLYFVTPVNIVIGVIVCIKVLKKMKYSPRWIFLFFIPIVNYIFVSMVPLFLIINMVYNICQYGTFIIIVN
jgi:hypothetical protein